MAEQSAAAMVEMDRAIQEVSQHVSEASGLTEGFSQGAQAGSEAVSATIEGIDEIRAQTGEAKAVLERLARRIAEIGEIVDVIGEINDETNLLSLNAAIIAAQAGEQGKAFAVVANHVKTLAQRTTSSTQEIEGLIHAVQKESSNAELAMAAGIEAVEKGVERSRKAGEELERIQTSSGEASSRVAEIARATGEQSRNSKHVAEAAQRTSSMVQQISGAMAEQTRAGETMLKNAESALEMCRQVHRSTEEQRQSGRFITDSISSVTEMIRSIQRNTESHGAASEAVAEAVTRILEFTRKSGERIPEVVESLESLRAEARSLAGAAGSRSEIPSPSVDGA
jgi:methyl-accepting chemotaxis protein